MDVSNKVDKELIKQRFSSAAKHYNKQAIVQSYIHQKILEYLSTLNINTFEKVLEVGCGTGILTQIIENKYNINNWVINDLTDCIKEENIFNFNRKNNVKYIFGDAENIELGNDYDLIISSSAIQWFHNPMIFINRLINRLKDNGHIILTTFSRDNLKEIKQILGLGLDYNTIDDYYKYVNNKDIEINIKQEHHILKFDSTIDILRHLKETGVTAVGSKGFIWTKSKLKEFENNYTKLYKTDDNKLSLTYNPLYIYIHKNTNK